MNIYYNAKFLKEKNFYKICFTNNLTKNKNIIII